MNMFSRAPMIGRHHLHGIWAEGDHASSLDHKGTFALAVASYGMLISPGERVTGAQWMRRIRTTYSEQEPRHRAVLEAIGAVMQVRQFADDHVLLHPNGAPAFRGRLAHCQVHARAMVALDSRWREAPIRRAADLEPRVCEDADAAMVNLRLVGAKLVDTSTRPAMSAGATVYEDHMFTGVVAPRYQLVVEEGEGAGLWHAQMHALKQSAAEESLLRGEKLRAIPAAGDVSLEAQLQLATDLARFAGYASTVTYGSSVPGWKPQPGDGSFPADPDLSAEQVRESLGKFVASLARHGWKPSPDAPLFLARPAALVNPHARQPHERVIHTQLVAWKLPDELVQHLYERATQRQVAGHRPGPIVAVGAPVLDDDDGARYREQESRRVYRQR